MSGHETHSDKDRVLYHLDLAGAAVQAVTGDDLREIQVELGLSDMSKTSFRKALGSLAAHDGAVLWKRGSWGSQTGVSLSENGAISTNVPNLHSSPKR